MCGEVDYTERLANHSDMDTQSLTLGAAADLLKRRAVSPVELTRGCLERIERLNPRLNAFITVTAETALEEARQAEAEIQGGGWRGPLHGIPLALKDLIDTAGMRTTAASALFKDRIPAEDAEVVRRLKAAGAVLLGKLNLHEFAYGGSSLVSYFGPVRNPWDTSRIAGGSSGGSGAAVAAGMCFGALGTDTAGSIRLPAAYCGIFGLKPTYGLVSARGVIPLSWSNDHVGPMARTARDAALLLNVIAGHDPEDLTSCELPVRDYAAMLGRDTTSLRIGIARDFFFADLDAEVAARVNEAIAVLRRITAGVRDVIIPVEADRTVAAAEAYAYHQQSAAEHPELYQPETLRRIRAGGEISAADYIRKRRDIEQLRREVPKIFAEVDLLITPTVPVPPPTFSELEAAPGELRRRELLMLGNTRPFNALGLPTISAPCGFTASGLPVGLQISGAPGRDDLVLQIADAYEQAAGTVQNSTRARAENAGPSTRPARASGLRPDA